MLYTSKSTQDGYILQHLVSDIILPCYSEWMTPN